jgi:glucokinase-like ROK family protein
MNSRNSVDHTTMREMNVTLILNTLRLHAPISRAGVAVKTGLNKASVSSMVRDQIASGFIEETGSSASSSEIGRPAINLRLNPDAGYIISAEIGVDFISIIATDFLLEIVARRYEDTTGLTDGEAILQYAFRLLKEVHQQVRRRGRPIFGLAVGVPGLVDMPAGTLLLAPNLGWRDLPLRDLLQAQFDLPIYLANEANMAALGESYFGTGQNSRLLVYVSSGVGVGGGIVTNGHLLTGVSGLAGEFGHMTIQPDGLPCGCGNRGCWETRASQTALFRAIRERIESGARSMLLDQTGGKLNQLTIPMIAHAARHNDAIAQAALEETARWLGIGLANLMNMLNPEHVVFGGKLSLAHELLMPVLQAEIEQRTFPWIRDQVTFAIAQHSADATVMGGAAMIHRDVLNHPLAWRQNASRTESERV